MRLFSSKHNPLHILFKLIKRETFLDFKPVCAFTGHFKLPLLTNTNTTSISAVVTFRRLKYFLVTNEFAF